MGLFDYSCLVTGINLGDRDATVVVLQQTDDGYRTVTPPTSVIG